MKKIGFTNFRKFRELSALTIAPVTFLVGANNAGKSTFLKGILYANENTCNLDVPFGEFYHPMFSFDIIKYDEDSSNFIRNVNYNYPDDEITVYQELIFADKCEEHTRKGIVDHGYIADEKLTRFKITMTISSSGDDTKNKAKINRFEIVDYANLLRFRYDFVEKNIYLEFLSTDTENEKIIYNRRYKVESKQKNLSKAPNATASRLEICELQKGTSIIASIKLPLKNYTAERNLDRDERYYTIPSLCRYIENIIHGYYCEFEKEEDNSTLINTFAKISKKFGKKVLDNLLSQVSNSAKSLAFLLGSPEIINIHSYHIKKSAYFDSSDRNDFVAKSINDFLTKTHRVPTFRITADGGEPTIKEIFHFEKSNKFYEYIADPSDEADAFILKWMGKENYNIGNNFKILSFEAGGFYSIEIEVEPNKWRYLSELGTGATRIMTLLLNLARAHVSSNALVVIEEPEQNLHPCFQSKLADLFADVKKSHSHVNLIVETHSEYVIRKAQVIHAKTHRELAEKEENNKSDMFIIYYFPETDHPYEMILREDGKFLNDFGPGFFDIAGDLAFELF